MKSNSFSKFKIQGWWVLCLAYYNWAAALLFCGPELTLDWEDREAREIYDESFSAATLWERRSSAGMALPASVLGAKSMEDTVGAPEFRRNGAPGHRSRSQEHGAREEGEGISF